MPSGRDHATASELLTLERTLAEHGNDLALFLVYDRPARTQERPGLARTFFAQRCVSDAQLDQMIDAFRSIGAYVELFDGEQPFLEALAGGRLQAIRRSLKVVYNGIGWGVAADGFQPGRKALIPAAADSYGIICANSDAYACAFALHKFHSFVVLKALGLPIPPVWHYRSDLGWIGEPPPAGVKVIAKSTYEAWSVGVTEESVFVVDDHCERHVFEIAENIGQPVTVQTFISGREACATVLSCPERLVLPVVEQVLAKAPGDPDAVMTIDDNLADGAVSYPRFDGPIELVDDIARCAVEVFDVLQLQAFGRIDFRLDADDRPWVTDVAVSPGLSLSSSAFSSMAELGIDHPTFLRTVVAATLGARAALGPLSATTRSPAA